MEIKTTKEIIFEHSVFAHETNEIMESQKKWVALDDIEEELEKAVKGIHDENKEPVWGILWKDIEKIKGLGLKKPKPQTKGDKQ